MAALTYHASESLVMWTVTPMTNVREKNGACVQVINKKFIIFVTMIYLLPLYIGNGDSRPCTRDQLV